MKGYWKQFNAMLCIAALIVGLTACGSSGTQASVDTEESTEVQESVEVEGSTEAQESVEAEESTEAQESRAEEETTEAGKGTEAEGSTEVQESAGAEEGTEAGANAEAAESAQGTESGAVLRMEWGSKEVNGKTYEGYFAVDDGKDIKGAPFAQLMFNFPEGSQVTKADLEKIWDMSGYYMGGTQADYDLSEMEKRGAPSLFLVYMSLTEIPDEYFEEDYMWDLYMEIYNTKSFSEIRDIVTEVETPDEEDGHRAALTHWACWNIYQAYINWQSTPPAAE